MVEDALSRHDGSRIGHRLAAGRLIEQERPGFLLNPPGCGNLDVSSEKKPAIQEVVLDGCPELACTPPRRGEIRAGCLARLRSSIRRQAGRGRKDQTKPQNYHQ